MVGQTRDVDILVDRRPAENEAKSHSDQILGAEGTPKSTNPGSEK